MLRSSLGFHTMTLSLLLEQIEVSKLISDFKKYSHNTGLIQMYHVDGKGTYSKYQPPNGDGRILPLNLRIFYHQKDIGIKWLIRYNTWSSNFKSYIVEAIINPKLLASKSDYITAATLDDMDAAIINFNVEAKRISSILKTFECYSLKRVDYCINFYLNELIPECDPDLVMALIKRGNIPPHYEEWTEYDDTAHRKKSKPSSFYLINSSVNINCYNKYRQLLEHSKENKDKGYPPVRQETLDAAQGIIRFEVQCKYHKMYSLANSAKKSGDENYNKYRNLLSYETCMDTISFYYGKTIKRGDWYSLQKAVRKIEHQGFNCQKEKRLIDTLKLIAQCRSIPQAKATLEGNNLDIFKKTLKDLSSLDINPVTIPKEWGIQYIPNLLCAYYDKRDLESDLRDIEKMGPMYLESYKRKRGIS